MKQYIKALTRVSYHCTDAYKQQAYYLKKRFKVAGETELLNNITALFDSGASCASRFSTIKKLSFSDNLFSIQRWLQRDICVFGGEPPAIGLQNNQGLEQQGHVQFPERWILLLGLYQESRCLKLSVATQLCDKKQHFTF